MKNRVQSLIKTILVVLAGLMTIVSASDINDSRATLAIELAKVEMKQASYLGYGTLAKFEKEYLADKPKIVFIKTTNEGDITLVVFPSAKSKSEVAAVFIAYNKDSIMEVKESGFYARSVEQTIKELEQFDGKEIFFE